MVDSGNGERPLPTDRCDLSLKLKLQTHETTLKRSGQTLMAVSLRPEVVELIRLNLLTAGTVPLTFLNDRVHDKVGATGCYSCVATPATIELVSSLLFSSRQV